jgi:hypothetical protein
MKAKYTYFIFGLILVVSFWSAVGLFSSQAALAQTAPTNTPASSGGSEKDCEKLKKEFESFGSGNLTDVFPKYCTTGAASRKVLNTILLFAGSGTVLTIMISGLRYTFSAGVPDLAKKAKQGMIWGFIGLIVILLAFALINIVTNFIVNGTLF